MQQLNFQKNKYEQLQLKIPSSVQNIFMQAIKPQEEETANKSKNSMKAALRLAEKEEQELIEKIGKHHEAESIKPVENYQQQKSVLMKQLDKTAQNRSKKEMKSIKAELSYLRCFQIHNNNQSAPKQIIAIMKRDLEMFTSIISKFVHGRVYPKASILETVAADRSKVRILLRGEIAVFEPINHKSYKNCLKLHQTKQYNNALMEALKNVAQFGITFDKDQPDYNELVQTINPEELELNQWQDLSNSSKTMSVETARKVLQKISLIGPTTPHRLSRHLKGQGHLICSDRHEFIIDQKANYQHTAICLGQCYVMELEYEVYRQAILHLNSDSQKKYIEVLLKKFETMDYFDAKQYIRKEYMINKYEEQQSQKKKEKENPKPLSQLQKNYIAVEQRPIYFCQESDSDDEDPTNKQKQRDRIQHYEIKYQNDLYLIGEGEVILQIDIIEETRLSSMEQASKVRGRHPRTILKLYKGDLFGFQEIGKIAEYNLTYLVKKDSNLLLMSQDVYIRHYYEIPGFKDAIKSIQKKRNELVRTLIEKIEKTVEEEQFRKYKSISNLQRYHSQQLSQSPREKRHSLLHSDLAPPRQLQYLGQKQFENEEKKLKMSIIKQKQGMDLGIDFKDDTSSKLNLRESLAFSSIYKSTAPSNCQIVGKFIEIRDPKGNLLRRRSISNAESQPSENKILRRLGVINDNERNQHNLKVITSRKSKYQLGDFKQEKKQFDRLKKMASSLPKIGYLYAKKEDQLFQNKNKLSARFRYKH